jgi:pilus assembly protein FimV
MMTASFAAARQLTTAAGLLVASRPAGTALLDLLVVGRAFADHRHAAARTTLVEARHARTVGGPLPAPGADAGAARPHAAAASAAGATAGAPPATHATTRTTATAARPAPALTARSLPSALSCRHLCLP